MKVIFILSGGLDSTTALYQLRKEHEVVEAVSFNYGQRHHKELESARLICAQLGLPHKVIDISYLRDFLHGSSLTTESIATPHGHYTADNMKLTIVPNRNAIMINIAAGYAVAKKVDGLGLGIHAGDHYIYPDCRPEFFRSQERTLQLANDCDFRLFAPFLEDHKVAIVSAALQLGVPAELTWTCYEGGEKPCNQCGSCIERIEAFYKNGVRDPLYTELEWEELTKDLST